MNSRAACFVRVHCPVAQETLAAALTDPAALERDATLAAMLAILRGGPLGDFGLYTGVVEIALGWEGFVPGPDAQPTAGEAGTAHWSPTVTLTSWFPADTGAAAIDAVLDALLAAHPWEIPVIETGETTLVRR